MSTKVFNTRLQLKYDSFEHWSAEANQFKLLAGEIAVVNVPAETGADGIVHEPAILFKVGDGEKTFNQLPWASGLAADVHAWAKKEHAEAADITVADAAGNFAGSNVEAVLAEIWSEIKTLTGGESGSVASQIQNGIEQFAATLGTAAYAATTDFDAAGTAASLIEQFAGTLGTAAYADTTDFDAAGTGAAEAAKVLGTTADEAGTATVHGALKSAAAADANANSRVLTSDFNSFKTTNSAAIEAAAKAGTDAADVVDGKLTEYKTSNDAALAGVKATADAAAVKADVDSAFEGVNATIATLATKADVEASFEGVNGEITDINEAIAGINEVAATHATKEELATAKEEASAAAAKALEDAQAYADGIKSDLLGDSETLEGTYDTLKEIAGWIATHEGETVVDLTQAIADEETARKAADEGFETRVSALEGKVDVDKVSEAIAAGVAGEAALREAADTALSNRIKVYEDNKDTYALKTEVEAAEGRAAADATSKANTAEANAKAHTDAEIDKVEAEVAKKANTADLHKVATSGKIEDLDQEVEYIIFNCGTATTLVSAPVTE